MRQTRATVGETMPASLWIPWMAARFGLQPNISSTMDCNIRTGGPAFPISNSRGVRRNFSAPMDGHTVRVTAFKNCRVFSRAQKDLCRKRQRSFLPDEENSRSRLPARLERLIRNLAHESPAMETEDNCYFRNV